MYDLARRRPLTGWLASAGRLTFLLLLVTVGRPITPPNNIIRLHDEVAAVKAIQRIQTMQVEYNAEYGGFATSLTKVGLPRAEQLLSCGPFRQVMTCSSGLHASLLYYLLSKIRNAFGDTHHKLWPRRPCCSA